jgi:enoyl-CoA hydratase
MARENVRFEVEDGIGLATFDRPAKLNALDARTLDELGEIVGEVERGAARALVLTGAGDRAFVAGGDLASMVDMTPEEALQFAERGAAVLDRLERLPVPTIAAVNGVALGGGCEVVLACDLVYASTRARLGQPEVNLGIIPGFGGTQRLPRRVGDMRALELLLSGEPVEATRAKDLGLVLEVLAPEELLPYARGKARTILSRGPLAVAAAKRLTRAGADLTLSAANALERKAFAALFATRDAHEGIRAFLEKRPPAYRGE